jgi:glycosyltransferase involved in cell wall biosynthesis
MSREQLLVITERYWPEGSGGELATHLILEILRKELDIVVLTGTQNPTKLPGVQYVYEPLLAKREKVWLWLNASRLANSRRFQKMLRESDVVYIPRFSFPIIPIAKRFGKNVIVHLHDYIPISYTAVVLAPYEQHRGRITRDDIMMECRKGLKYCVGISAFWWLPRLAKKWLSQADKIICVSKRQAEIITALVPELREKIEITYNPPQLELLMEEPKRNPDDIPTFLYVGGDSHIKGFHQILYAIKRLAKQVIKAKLILAGNYGYRNLQLIRDLIQRGNGIQVEVRGRIHQRTLFTIGQRVWALLFPSLTEEPLPYAVVESLLLGNVPISAAVGGVPEIISGTPAEHFLFKPGDAEGFVDKIRELASYTPKDVAIMGTELRQHALKLFNLENIEKALLKVFTE